MSEIRLHMFVGLVVMAAIGLVLGACVTESGEGLSGDAVPANENAAPVGAAQSTTQPGIDLLIEELARDITDTLADRVPVALTVSFFTTGTTDPQVSPYSDYLAEGLTTELAAIDQSGLSVVSRRAVEQILAEMEFQASELVDEETQARLGRLAGADVIFTGSVVSAEANTHVLNAQLIEVETGVVIWGARAPFAGAEHAERESSTTVTVVEQEVVSIQTGDLARTIIETFDDRRVRTAPSTEQVFWGPRFIRADGSVAPTGRGEGSALAYRYQAEFDASYEFAAFNDTDGYFTLLLSLDAVPAGSTGVTIEINPGGVSVLQLGFWENGARSVPLTVTPNEWQRLSLPFTLLADDRSPSEPATLAISVPYAENVVRYAMPTDATVSGEIQVDNIGFYERSEDASGGIAAVFALDLYESFVYVDYTRTDDGTVAITPGVIAVELRGEPVDGISGDGLRLSAVAEVTEELAAYVDAGRAFVLSAYVTISIPAGDQTTLSFDLQSDDLSRGDLDLSIGDAYSAYAEFGVSPFWGSASVELPAERDRPTTAVMSIRFPLSQQTMARGLEDGRIAAAVTVDRFRLE